MSNPTNNVVRRLNGIPRDHNPINTTIRPTLDENDPDDEDEMMTDAISANMNNPFTDSINHVLYHTFFGRTLIFIFEDLGDTIISALRFALGLSAYNYLKEEFDKTDLKDESTSHTLLIYFVITIMFLLAKRASTPYINLHMGGDYHNIYEHQAEILAIQKKMLQVQQEHLNSSIVMANAVQAQGNGG